MDRWQGLRKETLPGRQPPRERGVLSPGPVPLPLGERDPGHGQDGPVPSGRTLGGSDRPSLTTLGSISRLDDSPVRVLGLSVLPEPPASELDSLVARTAGFQPWRKIFHACNAVLVASAIAFLSWPRTVLLALLGGVVALALCLDLLRLKSRQANVLFFRTFGRLASPREARGIASSTWYALGVFAVVALFPTDIAIAGILVMGLGDPAAAAIGRALGRRPFLGGTLEGSAAFFVTSTLVLSVQHGWTAAAAAALTAALAERRSWPLDDNVAVPLVCAGTLAAMRWLGYS